MAKVHKDGKYVIHDNGSILHWNPSLGDEPRREYIRPLDLSQFEGHFDEEGFCDTVVFFANKAKAAEAAKAKKSKADPVAANAAAVADIGSLTSEQLKERIRADFGVEPGGGAKATLVKQWNTLNDAKQNEML